MAYVAGDALIIVRGTIGGVEEWANTWAVHADAEEPDPGVVTGLVHDFYENLMVAPSTIVPESITADSARYIDLFLSEDQPVTWDPLAGDNGNDQLPSEVALRVSLRSLTRRGGPFLPALGVDSVTSLGQCTTASQTAVVGALQDLLDAVAVTGAKIGLHSPTDTTVYPIVGAKVGLTFDVIRARRNELPEAYAFATIP